MTDRDKTTMIESSSDYEIPSAPTCELDALPAFVGEGWVPAEQISDPTQEETVFRAKLENGARIEVGIHFEPTYPLKSLSEHEPHHIQARGEAGNSGFGDTYIAGDFYIDHRKTNRRWDGRQWTGGSDELRVRRRPDTPERTTLVVDAVDVIERSADSKGRVTVGSEYAGKEVKIAVIDESE